MYFVSSGDRQLLSPFLFGRSLGELSHTGGSSHFPQSTGLRSDPSRLLQPNSAPPPARASWELLCGAAASGPRNASAGPVPRPHWPPFPCPAVTCGQWLRLVLPTHEAVGPRAACLGSAPCWRPLQPASAALDVRALPGRVLPSEHLPVGPLCFRGSAPWPPSRGSCPYSHALTPPSFLATRRPQPRPCRVPCVFWAPSCCCCAFWCLALPPACAGPCPDASSCCLCHSRSGHRLSEASPSLYCDASPLTPAPGAFSFYGSCSVQSVGV